MPLFQFGELVFGMETLVPQTTGHSNEYRWPKQDRFQRGPARQWTGEGDEKITFSGVIFPQFMSVGHKQLQQVKNVARQGVPHMLVDSSGYVVGKYVIEEVTEDREKFLDNAAPRKQTFTITFGRYFDDDQNGGDPFANGVDTGGGGGNVGNIA